MPPKRNNSSGRKKKWALIWWIESKSSNIIPLTTIPLKDRTINSITTLSWQNVSGKKEKFEAKVMAISYDPTELKKIPLSETGEICDPTQKIFSKEVLTASSNLIQQNKLVKSIKSDNLQKIDDVIRNNRGVFKTLDNINSQTLPNRRRDTPIIPLTSAMTSSKNTATDSRNSIVKISDVHHTMNDNDLLKNDQNPNINKRKHSKHTDDSSLNTSTTSPNEKRRRNTNSTKLSEVGKASFYVDNSQKWPSNKGCLLVTSSSLDENSDDCNQEKEFEDVNHENEDNSSDITDALGNNTNSDVEVEKHNNSQEMYRSNVRAFALQIPYEVTDQEIIHQQFLLDAYKYARSLKADGNSEKKLKYFLKPGDDRKEIAKGHKFYIGESVKHQIENRALKEPGVYDWQIIVKETLLYVYGNQVHNYCALGSNKGNHRAINEVLYSGLYEWACNRANQIIEPSCYIKLINTFCGNKRRYAVNSKTIDQCFEGTSGSKNSKASDSSSKQTIEPITSHSPVQAPLQINKTVKTRVTAMSSVINKDEITNLNSTSRNNHSSTDELLDLSIDRNSTTQLNRPNVPNNGRRGLSELEEYDENILEEPSEIVNWSNKFYFNL